jgi:hypothetical protein
MCSKADTARQQVAQAWSAIAQTSEALHCSGATGYPADIGNIDLVLEFGRPRSRIQWHVSAARLESSRMIKRSFDEPVQIKLLDHPALVRNARDAAQTLFDVRWPIVGPKYRKAVETCLKLLEGKCGSAGEAKKAFVDAALEAGILFGKQTEGAM